MIPHHETNLICSNEGSIGYHTRKQRETNTIIQTHVFSTVKPTKCYDNFKQQTTEV